jgi:hypothetical protein
MRDEAGHVRGTYFDEIPPEAASCEAGLAHVDSVKDELGKRGPAGNGSGEGEGGLDEAGCVEDGVEAEVSEVAGCLWKEGWLDLNATKGGDGGGQDALVRC